MKVCINILSSIFIGIAKDIKKYINEVYKINAYISTEMKDRDTYYICIGAHDIYWDTSGYLYDVYQFEQLESWHFKNEAYIKTMRLAQRVYDFSHIGAAFLQNIGIPALQKNYIRNQISSPINIKVYPISFIGSINSRRNEILQNVSAKCYNNITESEKYNIITKSQILLNIHFYPNAALEVARIEEMLSYSAFIISERSSDALLDTEYEGLIVFTDITEIKNTVKYYLNNPDDITSWITNMKTKLATRAKFHYELPLIDITSSKKENIYPEIDWLPINELNYDIKEGRSVLSFDNDINILPGVSIITITRNRRKFFDLMVQNYTSFIYDTDKIEWIIVDDTYDYSLHDCIKNKYINNLNYIYTPHETALSISEKRNIGIAAAKYDIICNMDDDDYYYDISIQSRVKVLINNKKISCVGCINYGIINAANSNGYVLKTNYIAEASMCFYKSFWEERNFYEHIVGEGHAFIKNRKYAVLAMPFEFNFIALNHKNNYTQTLRVKDINDKRLFNSLNLKTQKIIYKLNK